MNEARNLRQSQHAEEKEKQVWICFQFGKASLTSFIFPHRRFGGEEAAAALFFIYMLTYSSSRK